ncbi:hypothetical protein [Streptomyces mirabilis]|uniref:hypothetical protein n=1 Tax=Streptomyces mirabilis TaxID=68239 RepID=UPI00369E4DEB
MQLEVITGSDCMAVRVLYLVFLRLIGLLLLWSRSEQAKDAELLALRHQVAVRGRGMRRSRCQQRQQTGFPSRRDPTLPPRPQTQ